MDRDRILDFVNSKDIREHLKKIGYEFTPLEAAWLIYQCRSASVKEKHAAWNELIETTPDCSIPERRMTVPQDSLHAFLKEYMELEDEFIRRFKEKDCEDTKSNGKPYVYRFCFRFENDSYDYDTIHNFNIYSCFDFVYGIVTEYDLDEVLWIRCEKAQIDRDDSRSYVILSPGLEIMSVDPGVLSGRDYDIFEGVFEGLWFDYPTPFKKGDVVWDPERPDGFCGGPFVLTGLGLDGLSEKTKEFRIKDGDSTDMNAWGYYVYPESGIYHEVMLNYMDLEYFKKELTGAEKTLVPLSAYMKGEIDIGLFARAYHFIMNEAYSEM